MLHYIGKGHLITHTLDILLWLTYCSDFDHIPFILVIHQFIPVIHQAISFRSIRYSTPCRSFLHCWPVTCDDIIKIFNFLCRKFFLSNGLIKNIDNIVWREFLYRFSIRIPTSKTVTLFYHRYFKYSAWARISSAFSGSDPIFAHSVL